MAGGLVPAMPSSAGVPMCHVLIIEDEWLVADDLIHLVEEAGATSIATACTEDEAVQAARQHTPAIILSDVKLASGTGPGAVQTILSAQGEVPVIFITGSPEGCQDFAAPSVILPKPIDSGQVIETFKRLAPG